MALDAGNQIINTNTGIVAEGKDVSGGYFSIDNLSNIPSYARVTGALCYVTSDGKTYQFNGTNWVEKEFGASEFDDLNNRPKYNGTEMTSSTNIPEVKTGTWDSKQDALVSGTNIKTINSQSVLGSGNLSIDSLPTQTGHSGQFLHTDGTSATWEPTGTVDAQFTTTATNVERLDFVGTTGDVVIQQSTGTSTTDVMSQNAVTYNPSMQIGTSFYILRNQAFQTNFTSDQAVRFNATDIYSITFKCNMLTNSFFKFIFDNYTFEFYGDVMRIKQGSNYENINNALQNCVGNLTLVVDKVNKTFTSYNEETLIGSGTFTFDLSTPCNGTTNLFRCWSYTQTGCGIYEIQFFDFDIYKFRYDSSIESGLIKSFNGLMGVNSNTNLDLTPSRSETQQMTNKTYVGAYGYASNWTTTTDTEGNKHYVVNNTSNNYLLFDSRYTGGVSPASNLEYWDYLFEVVSGTITCSSTNDANFQEVLDATTMQPVSDQSNIGIGSYVLRSYTNIANLAGGKITSSVAGTEVKYTQYNMTAVSTIARFPFNILYNGNKIYDGISRWFTITGNILLSQIEFNTPALDNQTYPLFTGQIKVYNNNVYIGVNRVWKQINNS